MITPDNSLLKTLADGMNQGLIYVNEEGIIGEYSTLAKEIVGMILPEGKTHPAGQILRGDIVIIADNEIGNDDMMALSDFSRININDPGIEFGDAILAVGIYDDKKSRPEYKLFKEYITGATIELKTNYHGHRIMVSIDREQRQMSAVIDGEEYHMSYLDNIGYLVVLDGKTGTVKFFQEKGYGYRGEELGRILNGKLFLGKNVPGQPRDIHPSVGLPADRVLEGDYIIQAINELMDSEDKTTREGTYEVFRRMLYCVLIRISKGTPEDGVYILIQDKEHAEKSSVPGSTINKEIEKREKRAALRYGEILTDPFSGFIGDSVAMAKVKNLAKKAAGTRFNVILTGESGTGKSRLAREIHNVGSPGAPFVEVACNAITPSLIESELFGYVGGSFTGADSKGKAGFFEEANGGTIFLDEISEIPLELQVKLLNVLQNKRIYRVGSTKPTDVDVRIITASNRNLEEEVAAGRFRQDLYYRINVFPIRIPPLRERKRDLTMLANSILSELCNAYNMEQKNLSDEAIRALMEYDWPGNVRELENIIERAIVLCNGRKIYSEHLMIPESDSTGGLSLKERLDQEEKKIILEVLNAHHGSRKDAMSELGISKSVFYEKIKKYNIE